MHLDSKRLSNAAAVETHREVVNESARVLAQLSIEDALAPSLQQQQLVKRLKNVDGGLVDSAHNGAPRVDNVAHSPHYNGGRPGIQPCEQGTILCAQVVL